MSQSSMAELLDVTQPTISRERKRNRGLKGYRHQQAQRLSDQRRHSAIKAVKMTPSMIQRVESKLKEKWSPEQISGWLFDQGKSLSHETIYRHIWHDKKMQGELY